MAGTTTCLTLRTVVFSQERAIAGMAGRCISSRAARQSGSTLILDGAGISAAVGVVEVEVASGAEEAVKDLKGDDLGRRIVLEIGVGTGEVKKHRYQFLATLGKATQYTRSGRPRSFCSNPDSTSKELLTV
ncbi:hypothetical protein KEM55_001498, partial [Ascosphaera atra]